MGTADEFPSYHNKLLASNYDVTRKWKDIQQLHLDWGRRYCASTGYWQRWPNLKNPDKQLTIGYVSAGVCCC